MKACNTRALLGVLALSTTAVGLAAVPQYALIDLGATYVAGAGLAWQDKQFQQSPPSWPLAGGNQCLGPSANHIFAAYGNIAVGSSLCGGDFGEQAAKWTVGSGGTVTVTPIGVLPGSMGDVNGPFSRAYDFNNVGDIVGASQTDQPTYHAGCPCIAVHGFVYNNGTWTDLIPIAGSMYNSAANAVNDSHEVVGMTDTISSTTGEVLNRAFVYMGGTMYNLSFYLVGGPTVRLSDALWIDCQGNIAAVGTPAAGGNTHNYLLVRQGAARTNCPK
jgi:probable HAF family extracellular repeat protein